MFSCLIRRGNFAGNGNPFNIHASKSRKQEMYILVPIVTSLVQIIKDGEEV